MISAAACQDETERKQESVVTNAVGLGARVIFGIVFGVVFVICITVCIFVSICCHCMVVTERSSVLPFCPNRTEQVKKCSVCRWLVKNLAQIST